MMVHVQWMTSVEFVAEAESRKVIVIVLATFLMSVAYVAEAGIADGACDCAGNVLDECGICGGGRNR